MGYRDEKASLRARVAELESELAEKDEAIARLQGRLGTTQSAESSHGRVLDAPEALVLERTLDHGVSTEGLEAIATVLRERLQLPVSQVGRTLRGQQGTVLFELTTGPERTELRLQATYHDRRHGVLVVGPIAGLFSCGVALGILGPFGLGTAAMAAALTLAGVAAPLGLVRLVRRTVRKEQANVAGTFEAVAALAAAHREEPVRARVSVEAEAMAEAMAEVVEEAGTQES
jgi:hypothetical protein